MSDLLIFSLWNINFVPKGPFCNDVTTCSVNMLTHSLILQSSTSLPKFESQKVVFLLNFIHSTSVFLVGFSCTETLKQYCSSVCTNAEVQSVVDVYRP